MKVSVAALHRFSRNLMCILTLFLIKLKCGKLKKTLILKFITRHYVNITERGLPFDLRQILRHLLKTSVLSPVKIRRCERSLLLKKQYLAFLVLLFFLLSCLFFIILT